MGKRLLVVDSDRRFIQDHKSQLESAFEVDFLYATEGALTRLESGQYGAILLCVETSENKGYALCSAIRRTPLPGELRIALISAKASEEEYARHRATKGKADLYLHKPINSGALIPSLAALVPMKEDDPDNPLGDLAGTDLGDEWLESLKSELDTGSVPTGAIPAGFVPAEPALPDPAWLEPAAVSAPKVIAPAPGWAAEPPPARADGQMELLEFRVKDLELKLAAQSEQLNHKSREIEELHRQNAAVTRNLDEAQQHHGESDLLRQKLLEQDADNSRLQDELRQARDEHMRLLEQQEDASALLSEKTQQHAELMESHQLLQTQLEEAWEAGDRVKVLEGSLAEAQDAARILEGSLAEAQEAVRALDLRAAMAEQNLLELQDERDALRSQLDALRAEQEALRAEQEALRAERDGLRAELDGLHAEQDGLHAELAGKLERIQELEAGLGRLKELEEELGSAKDQVSFQELTLRKLAEERAHLQAERDRQDDALTEQAGELIVQQEKVALLETAGKDLREERDALLDLRQQLEVSVAGLERQMEAAETAHDTLRGELMTGLGERDAALGRVNAILDAQKEQIARLEQERQGLETQVRGREAHLQDLAAVLSDLEGKARQALDLAKAVSS